MTLPDLLSNFPRLWRILVAAALAGISSLILTGLFTIQSLNYWGNAAMQLAGFMIAGAVAGTLARQDAVWAAVAGIAILWTLVGIGGIIGAIVLRRSLTSPVLLFGDIAVSVAVASVFGRRRFAQKGSPHRGDRSAAS